MVREFVETILELLVRHMLHERAAMLRRGHGELEHGGADVCESRGCLVLVLVWVVVSFKAHFLYLLFFFSAILIFGLRILDDFLIDP